MSKPALYQKISKVMGEVRYLSKDDNIAFKETKYKAISEEKVTSTVRESLLRHGLIILPVKQDHKRDGTLTTVDTEYKIVDIDTGEYEILASSGTGADTQDKGVGKAMTYAYKYLLLRTFAIPTGEDPDKISSAELDAKQAAEREKEEAERRKREEYLNSITVPSVIAAKYTTFYGKPDGMKDWYAKCLDKSMDDAAIETWLTEKLVKKNGGK